MWIRLENTNQSEKSFYVFPSGSIDLASGSYRKLDVDINGNGNINASGITVQKTSIILRSSGQVTIGRVIENSIEQIMEKGVINILNRGKV